MIRLRIEDKALNAELARMMEENKEFLHKVCRGEEKYEDSLGWLHVQKWAGEEQLREIHRAAEKIREDAEVFVLIGVGGSNNGARSVIEGLGGDGKVKILYAGNTLSPYQIKKTLRELEGKSVYINCIAKNFETLEPGAAFRVFRKFLYDKYKDRAGERIIATGTRGSLLEQLCEDHGYTFLEFPQDVGGRFSCITSVGLLPMAVAGIDIYSLVQGAAAMEKRLFEEGERENPAFAYACLRNLYYRKGYKVEFLASFEPQFRWFYKWWIQLFAESEGKDNQGLFPAAGEFCEELHAVGQYIQEGAPLLFETFLDVQEQNASLVVEPDARQDAFDYLNGKDFWDINKASYAATVKAHREKLPCLILDVERLDPWHFGQLFYFFMFSCYLSAGILGVNPFNQPGVEAYKTWMFDALGK